MEPSGFVNLTVVTGVNIYKKSYTTASSCISFDFFKINFMSKNI